MLDETFEKELDALLTVANNLRDAEIDAGACRTEHDYRKARKLRDEYEDSYATFLTKYKTELARLG